MRENVSTRPTQIFIRVKVMRVALGTKFVVDAGNTVAHHTAALITSNLILRKSRIIITLSTYFTRTALFTITQGFSTQYAGRVVSRKIVMRIASKTARTVFASRTIWDTHIA